MWLKREIPTVRYEWQVGRLEGSRRTHLRRNLSLESLSLAHASLRTSIIYVPGVTLTLALLRSVDRTST